MDELGEARITLRLPLKLRERLAKSATENERSMNGEIVFRLDDYDRVVVEIARIVELLEQREEALFSDRVRLRKLVPHNQELSGLLEAKQQEIQNLLAELNESHRREGELDAQLRERQNEIVALREQTRERDARPQEAEAEAEKLRFKISVLREKVAYQEGMNASLRANLEVFVRHMVSPENDAKAILDRIIEDIEKLQPPATSEL